MCLTREALRLPRNAKRPLARSSLPSRMFTLVAGNYCLTSWTLKSGRAIARARTRASLAFLNNKRACLTALFTGLLHARSHGRKRRKKALSLANIAGREALHFALYGGVLEARELKFLTAASGTSVGSSGSP